MRAIIQIPKTTAIIINTILLIGILYKIMIINYFDDYLKNTF